MIFGKNINQDESNDMLDCMISLIIDRELIHSNPNNFHPWNTLPSDDIWRKFLSEYLSYMSNDQQMPLNP